MVAKNTGTTHPADIAANIHTLARAPMIAAACARIHTDAADAAVVRAVCARVSNFETASARNVFYYVAACVRCHHDTRARYSVAVRACVVAAGGAR